MKYAVAWPVLAWCAQSKCPNNITCHHSLVMAKKRRTDIEQAAPRQCLYMTAADE